MPAKIIFSVGPVTGNSLVTCSITFGAGHSIFMSIEFPKVLDSMVNQTAIIDGSYKLIKIFFQ